MLPHKLKLCSIEQICEYTLRGVRTYVYFRRTVRLDGRPTRISSIQCYCWGCGEKYEPVRTNATGWWSRLQMAPVYRLRWMYRDGDIIIIIDLLFCEFN